MAVPSTARLTGLKMRRFMDDSFIQMDGDSLERINPPGRQQQKRFTFRRLQELLLAGRARDGLGSVAGASG
jgi:hypothetical protein